MTAEDLIVINKLSLYVLPIAILTVPALGQEPRDGGSAAESPSVNWPQFRGYRASGIAQGTAPTKWNAEKGENIKWKTPIPGLGHSSPIVWGDRVFITTCVSSRKDPELKVGLYGDITSVDDSSVHEWRVLCLDKNTGEVLWNETAHKGIPKVKRHPKATHANSTPVTDGRHVVAFFGSEGLYCYTLDGKLVWKKDLGVLDAGFYLAPEAQWEFGSSPVIHDGMVIVQCDVQKDPFIAAFDIESGTTKWRTNRDDVCTWSTPTIHESPDRTQLITNGFRHIGGYDVATGAELWRLRGGGDIPVPTPVVAHDLIFITNSHGAATPVYAIRTSATGDISLEGDELSNDHIAWSHMRIGNYMQTPIVYADCLYCCRDSGIMACYDARTGKKHYSRRMRGHGFTASPVAAGGHVYFTSEDGDVYVVEAGPRKKIPTSNRMGEVCMATPAISDGRIYIRGKHHLFCIGE